MTEPTTFALEWHLADDPEHHREVVSAPEALSSRLDELQALALTDFPFMIDLVADDGRTLGIGLGRPVSVAHWISENGDPPYFVSHGELGGVPETVVFFARAQWTEFAGVNAIDNQAARAAIEVFFETGEKDPAIQWDEV